MEKTIDETIGEKATSRNKKRSRENTVKEKRRMRKNRKKRKRLQASKSRQISTLKAKADLKHRSFQDSKKKIAHYRMMARSYWERWDRELHERKEAIRKHNNHLQARVPYLLEIDHTLLHNPGFQKYSWVRGRLL